MTKDVDLVIRARTEGAKAVDLLTAALETFAGSSDKVASSAKKTDGVLGALKQEFIELGRQADNLSNLNTVAKNLDKATEAVKRLETNVEKSVTDLNNLTRASNDAAAASERMGALSKAGTAGIDQQRAAIKATSKDLRDEAAEVRRLESELNRLASARTKASVAPSRTGSPSRQDAHSYAQGQLEDQRRVVAEIEASLKNIKPKVQQPLSKQDRNEAAVYAAAQKVQRTSTLATGASLFKDLFESLPNMPRGDVEEAIRGLVRKRNMLWSQFSDPKSYDRNNIGDNFINIGGQRSELFALKGTSVVPYTPPVQQSQGEDYGVKILREGLARERAKLAVLQREADDAAKAVNAKKLPGADLRNELPGSTAQQSAAAFLRGELEAAKARQAATAGRLETQKASLAATQEGQQGIAAQAAAAATQQRNLSSATDTASAALAREQARLETARTALAALQGSASSASTAMGGLAATQEAVAAAAARVAATQAQAKARIDGLAGNRTVTPSSDATTLNRQKLEARREHVAATEDVKALARAMREADAPTEAMGAALGRAQATARLAKQEYLALAEAAHRLSSSQQAAQDAAQRASTAQEAAAAAAARVAAAQAQAKARIDGLNGAKPVVPASDPVALNRQKLEARRDYVGATEEVKALARAMREADSPTKEMGATLGRAQAAARLAKQEYLALAEAAHRVSSTQGSFKAFSAGISSARAAVPAPAAPLPPIAPMGNTGAPAAAAGMREGAEGAKTFREALKGLYGDSRESLSLMQRLRGEVLSLAASFIGFQAAAGGVRAVVNVFREMEGVQSRLGAVFAQDTSRVASEIDFLKRTADRLGISFTTLAKQYGALAIAGKEANLSAEDTRKIFLAVAEAGVVNRLSSEQVGRTFLAITQMMSKGKISAEELRQQLGDALPGAMGIMAAAIGVSNAELDRMMKNGEVIANSQNLTNFADELNKRFGPQLSSSIAGTTAEIGRFQNGLQEAALIVANGGLIDGFTSLLKTLNDYFKSPEGRDFFLGLGAAAQRFFGALTALVPHLDAIKTIFGAIIAYKVAQAFVALGGVIRSNVTDLARAAIGNEQLSVAQRMAGASTTMLGAQATALNRQLVLMQVGLELTAAQGGVMAGRFAVASAAVGAFRAVALATVGVLRGLLAAFGGVAGLVVTGLTVAAGYWLTSVEGTTDALATHKALIDQVVTKYEEAKDKTKDWASEIKELSQVQVAAQIEGAAKELATARRNVVAPTMYGPDDFGNLSIIPQSDKLTEQVNLFRAGKISLDEFKKSVDEVAKADPSLDKKLLSDLIASAKKADDLSVSIDKLKAVLALMQGNASDAQKRLLGLQESFKDTGAKKATADLEAFNDALNDIRKGIPALAVELKKMKDYQDAFDAAKKAVAAANGDEKLIGEATAAYSLRMTQIKSDELQGYIKQFGGDKIPNSLVSAIYGGEGYRSNAYLDSGGKPTIGFGSTSVNGKPVAMGDTISMQDAVKQMVADLSKFGAMVDSATAGAKLGENQRNALISYVYNVGNTDGTASTRAIFDKIRQNRPDQEVADAIANGVATVNGSPSTALRDRRRREAGTYLTPDDRLNGQDTGVNTYDREKARIDAQRTSDKGIDDANARRAFDAANQKKINDAENQTAARRSVELAQAEYEYRKKIKDEGVEFSQARLDEILKTTAALYDQNHVNDQAKEAEEKVNALYRLRQQLLEELKVATEQGDGAQIATTRKSIEDTNVSLRESIALAVKYWQAIGGTEADTAIAKLKVMSAQTEKNKTQILTAGQANEMLAAGMTRAFDTAAQGIGKAIAGTGSWKDAIKGVGTAFLSFAADFLREIANMIIKQMILNALQSAMGSGGGGAGGGVGSVVAAIANVAVAHTGGIVGANSVGVGNGTRIVNPAWFENAQRFHNGGIPGLAPGEVPTILKRNEEVLTENDPRHALNGGGRSAGNAGPTSIKSILVMDPNLIPEAMATTAGEQVIVSAIKSNKATIKRLLG